MSKKTLIILLVIVVIGILIIVLAGQKTEYTDEQVLPIDDNDTILEDFELYVPVEDDTFMEEVPVIEEDTTEEDVMDEELVE